MIIMSENRFVSGNVIVLYCNYVSLDSTEQLPEYIMERIRVCVKTHQRIMASKPDKSDTEIIVVADKNVGSVVKNYLVSYAVEESKIILESSNNIGHVFSVIIDKIKKRPNPPVVYFVSSYHQKDFFDSAAARYRGYKIQFEGALDKRPTALIEEDAKREKINKGLTNIKEKGKNKVFDMLLNYIFPDSKK